MNLSMLPLRSFFPSSTNTFFITIFFFFFFFFLVLQTALSADPQYEACVPQNCGTLPNISYPFWIDNQESYCGHPEYSISCFNQRPFIRNLSSDYYIRNISYEDYSIFISTTPRFSNPSCPHPLQNLPHELTPYHLNDETNLELNFYLNCTGPYPNSTDTSYNISCLPHNNTHYSLIHMGPPFSEYPNCEYHFIKPVVREEEGSVNESLVRGNYGAVMELGFVLKWIPRNDNCSICEFSGGHCGYNTNASEFLCFCPDRPYSISCPESDKNEKLKPTPIMPVVTIIFVLIYSPGICLLGICLLGKKLLMKKKDENSRIVDNFCRTYEPPGPIRYNYRDVKKMFNSSVDELGKGGFGSVYKGKLPDDRRVAVKVLSESKGNGEDFINEVASIGRTEHVNIVSLLGYCYEGRKRALIYEFMPNGSLDKIIYKQEPRASHALGWAKLYEIAVGTARGLEYLHGGCNTRILHFDIKPHNILLDEDFSPKISDFGLAKLCPTRQSTISMLDARGTAGYTAPEVYCRNVGGVSSKSDVYSYGMMLLEMVGGRKNIDALVENTSEIYFPHWIHRRLDLDGDLGLGENLTEEEEETVRKMIIVGLWCIQLYPAHRPSTSKVLEMLEGSLDGLQMPPNPIFSFPSKPNEATVVVDIAEGSPEGSHISA